MPAAVPLIVQAAATSAGLGVVATAALTIGAAAIVGSIEQDRAEKKARAARNASLQDRLITVRSGVSTRKYVLGTHRVGGTLMYAESIGPNQTALDTIIAMAANRCEMVGIYLGDEYVPAGSFPGQKFGHVDVLNGAVAVQGATSVATGYVDVTTTLAADPLPGSVTAFPAGMGEGTEGWSATVLSVSGRSVTVRLSGGSYVTASVGYAFNGPAKIRAIFKDGDHNQGSSGWADYASPLWTANHRLRGIAHLRTLMLWDENVYASGAPEVGAVLRGWGYDTHLIYDPRTGTNVAYSDNPAILTAWWMTLPERLGGCGYQQDWIDWESVKTAANVCDELITVRKIDSPAYEQIKRYQCHTVLDTAVSPIENRNAILRSMAGKRAFTNGKYRIVAGAYRPPTLTLRDNDLVGTDAIEMVAAGADSAPPNIVTARFSDATKAWVESSPPPVRNDTYVASDGTEVTEDLDLSCTTDPRQANYLQGVALEEMRPRFTVNLKVGGIGENIALLDVVALEITNRPSYGGRALEVVKWADNWDGTFSLTLVEIKASTYALDADRFTPTAPAPVADLSYLWNVAAVDGFTASLGAPQVMPDGTSVTAVQLSWSGHSQVYVRQTGRIELRYRRVGLMNWSDIAPTTGDSTGTTFSAALLNTASYEFQARAKNGLGAVSAWTSIYVTVAGSQALISHTMTITPDPAFENLAAWVVNGTITRELVTWNRFGRYAMRADGASAYLYTKRVPFDAARRYRATVILNANGGTTRRASLMCIFYDANGAVITGTADPAGWTWVATFHYFLNGQTVPQEQLTEYSIAFGAGETVGIPSAARFISIGAILHDDDGVTRTGSNWLCHARIQQLQDTALIGRDAATEIVPVTSDSGTFYGSTSISVSVTNKSPDTARALIIGSANVSADVACGVAQISVYKAYTGVGQGYAAASNPAAGNYYPLFVTHESVLAPGETGRFDLAIATGTYTLGGIRGGTLTPVNGRYDTARIRVELIKR